MSFELPDGADFDTTHKAYFRRLRQKHKTKAAIMKESGLSRGAIDRRFKRWGWGKNWVEPDDPAASPPPATAPSPTPAPPAASPPKNNGPTSRDFLEPDVRAKLEAMKKKKKKP